MNRRWARPSSAALLALLAALLVRAIIPAGYMLAPGEAKLVPCAGTIPVPSHHGNHDPDRSSEVPCAFASVVPPALPDPPAVAAPFALPRPPVVDLPTPRPVASAPAVLLPPSTGPPAA